MRFRFLILVLIAFSNCGHVNAAGSLAEALKGDSFGDPFIKTAAVITATPISPIVGVARGAVSKTKSSFEGLKYSEMNVVSKAIASPFIGIYGLIAGGMRGFFTGLTNAFENGTGDDPFSKETYSLGEDQW